MRRPASRRSSDLNAGRIRSCGAGWLLAGLLAGGTAPDSAAIGPLAAGTGPRVPASCPGGDFTTRVEGLEHCLVMARYGADHPRTLVVWLHDDLPGSGPADYHLTLARETARRFAEQGVMSVALLRPGYPDAQGARSGGEHRGRSDHYTLPIADEIAAAIERLRARFDPATVIAVGHGGGAAMAAIVLGRHPRLLDGAVLVGCPCDLVLWRMGRRYWGRSQDPVRWTGTVRREARVMALTGERDSRTTPELAQSYVELLQTRGVDARFRMIAQADHETAARSPQVQTAIGQLIGR